MNENRKNKYILFLILFLFNSLLLIVILKTRFIHLIKSNFIVFIILLIEAIAFNYILAYLIKQYSLFKNNKFGEIIKFKFLMFAFLTILFLFTLFSATFFIINKIPGQQSIYESYNTSIENYYLQNLEELTLYEKDILQDIQKIKDNQIVTNSKILLIMKTNTTVFQHKTFTQYSSEHLMMIKDRIPTNTLYLYKDNDYFYIFSDDKYFLIFTAPIEKINQKEILYKLLSLFKNIHLMNKNNPVIYFFIMLTLIIPLIFFLLYFIIQYFNKLILPLKILLNKFTSIPTDNYEQIIYEGKESNEFTFLIKQFNTMQKLLEQRNLYLKYKERYDAFKSITTKFAHEIKNPLTPIQLSLDLIRKKYPYNDDFRDYFFNKIDTIEQNCNIIRDNISKFYSSSNVNEAKTIIDLIFFLKEVKEYWISQDCLITIQYEETASYLLNANKEDLKIAFNNLIINSMEACGKQTKITIKIKADEKNIVIYFEDNGTGIPLSILKYVFEPFFTTKEHGSGIGLTIIRDVIHSINGIIEYKYNPNPHFFIQLPLAKHSRE